MSRTRAFDLGDVPNLKIKSGSLPLTGLIDGEEGDCRRVILGPRLGGRINHREHTLAQAGRWNGLLVDGNFSRLKNATPDQSTNSARYSCA